eukprot:GHVN01013321.1.p1 GENE.GHVN01013321.1~~GHVN01013321.1.p1  ORF type:complete len:1115 (-),score=144.56 GHVN01013321.1:529-3450(-)
MDPCTRQRGSCPWGASSINDTDDTRSDWWCSCNNCFDGGMGLCIDYHDAEADDADGFGRDRGVFSFDEGNEITVVRVRTNNEAYPPSNPPHGETGVNQQTGLQYGQLRLTQAVLKCHNRLRGVETVNGEGADGRHFADVVTDLFLYPKIETIGSHCACEEVGDVVVATLVNGIGQSLSVNGVADSDSFVVGNSPIATLFCKDMAAEVVSLALTHMSVDAWSASPRAACRFGIPRNECLMRAISAKVMEAVAREEKDEANDFIEWRCRVMRKVCESYSESKTDDEPVWDKFSVEGTRLPITSWGPSLLKVDDLVNRILHCDKGVVNHGDHEVSESNSFAHCCDVVSLVSTLVQQQEQAQVVTSRDSHHIDINDHCDVKNGVVVMANRNWVCGIQQDALSAMAITPPFAASFTYVGKSARLLLASLPTLRHTSFDANGTSCESALALAYQVGDCIIRLVSQPSHQSSLNHNLVEGFSSLPTSQSYFAIRDCLNCYTGLIGVALDRVRVNQMGQPRAVKEQLNMLEEQLADMLGGLKTEQDDTHASMTVTSRALLSLLPSHASVLECTISQFILLRRFCHPAATSTNRGCLCNPICLALILGLDRNHDSLIDTSLGADWGFVALDHSNNGSWEKEICEINRSICSLLQRSVAGISEVIADQASGEVGPLCSFHLHSLVSHTTRRLNEVAHLVGCDSVADSHTHHFRSLLGDCLEELVQCCCVALLCLGNVSLSPQIVASYSSDLCQPASATRLTLVTNFLKLLLHIMRLAVQSINVSKEVSVPGRRLMGLKGIEESRRMGGRVDGDELQRQLIGNLCTCSASLVNSLVDEESMGSFSFFGSNQDASSIGSSLAYLALTCSSSRLGCLQLILSMAKVYKKSQQRSSWEEHLMIGVEMLFFADDPESAPGRRLPKLETLIKAIDSEVCFATLQDTANVMLSSSFHCDAQQKHWNGVSKAVEEALHLNETNRTVNYLNE